MASNGIDRLPDKAGGQVIDGSRLPSMNLKRDGGDAVREALNRAEYFYHIAVGEVDGYAVQVVAKVTGTGLTSGFRPKLTITVGGEWDHETGTYLGGSTTRRSFDTVWQLNGEFGALCREHGLLIIPPGWPEKAEQSSTDTDRSDGGDER
jgi:hypothetical protein